MCTQIFNITMNDNFHPILVPLLLGSQVSGSAVSWTVRALASLLPALRGSACSPCRLLWGPQLGIGTLLTPVVAFTLTWLVHQHGTSYFALRGTFTLKVGAGLHLVAATDLTKLCTVDHVWRACWRRLSLPCGRTIVCCSSQRYATQPVVAA